MLHSKVKKGLRDCPNMYEVVSIQPLCLFYKCARMLKLGNFYLSFNFVTTDATWIFVCMHRLSISIYDEPPLLTLVTIPSKNNLLATKAFGHYGLLLLVVFPKTKKKVSSVANLPKHGLPEIL